MSEFDLIFVLAGRPVRKLYGLELFRAGVAPRILFSVARFEIRRFRELPLPVEFDLLPVALPVPAEERHFFVLFDGSAPVVERIAVQRFGTLRETEGLGGYLARHREIRSVLVVTSAVHVRRVRICCGVILPRGVRFEIAPVPLSGIRGSTGKRVIGSGEEDLETARDAGLKPGATKSSAPSVAEIGLESLKFCLYRLVLLFRWRGRA